jgi:hypothetical protein
MNINGHETIFNISTKYKIVLDMETCWYSS